MKPGLTTLPAASINWSEERPAGGEILPRSATTPSTILKLVGESIPWLGSIKRPLTIHNSLIASPPRPERLHWARSADRAAPYGWPLRWTPAPPPPTGRRGQRRERSRYPRSSGRGASPAPRASPWTYAPSRAGTCERTHACWAATPPAFAPSGAAAPSPRPPPRRFGPGRRRAATLASRGRHFGQRSAPTRRGGGSRGRTR